MATSALCVAVGKLNKARPIWPLFKHAGEDASNGSTLPSSPYASCVTPLTIINTSQPINHTMPNGVSHPCDLCGQPLLTARASTCVHACAGPCTNRTGWWGDHSPLLIGRLSRLRVRIPIIISASPVPSAEDQIVPQLVSLAHQIVVSILALVR